MENYKTDAIDSVLMKVYGMSNEQYYGYNSDYQKLLLDNFYKILRKREMLNDGKVKKKKKVLSLFRK